MISYDFLSYLYRGAMKNYYIEDLFKAEDFLFKQIHYLHVQIIDML